MDNSNSITFISAFAAGLVSFLSPCVLPILPTYSAFLAGTGTASLPGARDKWRLLINAVFFLSGFTLIFVAMGATASYFGQVLSQYQGIIRRIGAIFMVLMGLHLLQVIRFSVLHREYRPFLANTFQGPGGAFILGIAFTVGWTPCIGPILASVLVYAGTTATLGQGVLLLLIYALGFSIPFLTIAVLLNKYVCQTRKLYKWLPLVQQASGVVLIITGMIMYFDLMQKGLGMIWNLFG